jgi:hypothetical protein
VSLGVTALAGWASLASVQWAWESFTGYASDGDALLSFWIALFAAVFFCVCSKETWLTLRRYGGDDSV